MDPLVWLVLLSAAMFVGSFLVGTIPLAFHLSEERLRVISAFGIGLLVGTSLIVIIPEGIETLYSVQKSSEYTPNLAESVHLTKRVGASIFERGRIANEETPPDTVLEVSKREVHDPQLSSNDDLASQDDIERSPDIPSDENPVHRYIGIALISGFALMFIIDQIDAPHQHHNRVNDPHFTELNSLANSLDPEDDNDQEVYNDNTRISTNTKSHSTTIGLIIHAAADGIALGASASQPALGLIVFLAVMLHKAPSAFGLCTVLLREGYTRQQIRLHVIMFSLSAPLAAIITFMALQSSAQLSPDSMRWWTAILLLFSGGTFLYVAMHVMQIVSNSKGNSNRLAIPHVAALVSGMFFPMLLELNHRH